MGESLQKWLGRNRPPRVQITYDVETLGAIEKKELPFVVGILADLMGARPFDKKLKDRKFVEIDRDNFPDLMKTLAPKATFKVPNRLDGAAEGDETTVNLTFRGMDDFRADQVLLQLAGRNGEPAEGEESPKVEALAALVDERERLAELLARLDLKEDLAELLREMLGGEEA